MDLTFTPEEEAFRKEARSWLGANVPSEPLPSLDTAEGFEKHREWEHKLNAAGWAMVPWPVEFGGRGANLIEWLIFARLGVTITGGTMRDLDGSSLVLEVLSTDPSESGDTFIPGDVDGDGLVTDADKTLLKALIKPSTNPPTAEELMAGDLSGDAKLSEKDLVLLMQMLDVP